MIKPSVIISPTTNNNSKVKIFGILSLNIIVIFRIEVQKYVAELQAYGGILQVCAESSIILILV